jgi:hypothetical protein
MRLGRVNGTRSEIYHLISRVVNRLFVVGTEEKEKFRTFDADEGELYEVSGFVSLPNG